MKHSFISDSELTEFELLIILVGIYCFNLLVLLDFALTVKAATFISIYIWAWFNQRGNYAIYNNNLVRVNMLLEPRKRTCIS